MNKIEELYKKETGENPINSQGEPDIDYVKWLESRIKELEEILNSFDWEIRGNHALTQTCTRLTEEQIKLLKQINPCKS